MCIVFFTDGTISADDLTAGITIDLEGIIVFRTSSRGSCKGSCCFGKGQFFSYVKKTFDVKCVWKISSLCLRY